MKKIYQILVLGLSYIYNSLGMAMESPSYIITIHSEIRPELQDNKLNLCRVSKTLLSDIPLITPKDNIINYTDLIYNLLFDLGTKSPLDILVDNFIRSQCRLCKDEDLLRSNLVLSSLLINITTMKKENIAKRLISTYTTEKKEGSDIYSVPIFSIKDQHDTDITEALAERFNLPDLAFYVKNFRELIPQGISLPEQKDNKEEFSMAILEYQRSITNLISGIIETKNQIFGNMTYTKINYYFDFIVNFLNETTKERVDKIFKIGEMTILTAPITLQELVPLFVFQVSYSPADLALVSTLKNKVDELQKSLNDILLTPLLSLTTETDKYNFVGYIQLLQLFISNPYR